MNDISLCVACGYNAAPLVGGAAHVYMGPSPECWALYGEILVRKYSDVDYARAHRLMTDAYCAQHSVGEDRRARKSLHIHLAALMLHFEDGCSQQDVVQFLKSAAGSEDFPPLAAPAPKGRLTIERIHVASNADEHWAAVQVYGAAAPAARRVHHSVMRALIERHAA